MKTACSLVAGPAQITTAPRPHLQNRRAHRWVRAGIPQQQVLGIDILDRAPGLARHVIAASDVADRVTGRTKNVADFAHDAGFDLAWLPAPFIPQPAVAGALSRAAAALHHGGWLVLGHS